MPSETRTLGTMTENFPKVDPFRLMVDNIKDCAIFLIDPQGKIKTWNLGAQRLKGYEPAEIIGKDFTVFYSESDVANGKPQKILKTAKENGRAEDEGWRVKKDGSRFWAWVVLTAVYEGEDLVGFAKITRDLTERRKWEAELEKKVEDRTKELRQINNDLEQFAYVSSHDLQEPLRIVKLYSDLLIRKNKEKMDEESKKYLGYISEGAQRAQVLIEELLEYSRISHKSQNFNDVELEKIVKKSLSNLRLSIQEKGASIEHDALPRIRGSEFLLLRLFENLFSNALKYSDKPPRIRVTSELCDGEYVIAVSDNGIGIEPEFRETIFEIFKRLHSRDQYPGTGIGLAMCKKIVEMHDGRIWVESKKGEGSVFKFALPLPKEKDFTHPRY